MPLLPIHCQGFDHSKTRIFGADVRIVETIPASRTLEKKATTLLAACF
jgi:hypothetical protein